MATYSIGDLSRREILEMSAMVGIAGAISTKYAIAQAALQRTPHQILGPFYPMKSFDQMVDLTRVPGRPGRAEQRHGASAQSGGRASSQCEG
jgi:protocatechuate 3,4-dioxygenase beta subunit